MCGLMAEGTRAPIFLGTKECPTCQEEAEVKRLARNMTRRGEYGGGRGGSAGTGRRGGVKSAVVQRGGISKRNVVS
jgi:hypothetical protein